VLARRGNLIILTSAESGDLVDLLLDALEQLAAAGGDGRQFADAVAELIEADSAGLAAEPGPSVLAFGPVGHGMAATVCGTAWAEIGTERGDARVEASQPGMLLRCVLTSPVGIVVGGLDAGAPVAASTDRFSRLDAGTVRASGLRYHLAGQPSGAAGEVAQPSAAPRQRARPAEPEPAPAEPVLAEPVLAEPAAEAERFDPALEQAPVMPEAVPSAPSGFSVPSMPGGAPAAATPMATELWSIPAQDLDSSSGSAGGNHEATIAPVGGEGFDAVMLVGAGPGDEVELDPREPLPMASDLPPGTASYASEAPMVEGVYCQNGHFQDPAALSCADCGVPIGQQQPRYGPRPPLGVLMLDDGSVFQLDADYVVGREPGLDASVAAGQSRPLRVADDSGIVSRVHARVRLDGWQVTVTDLGSANGTKVRFPNGAGEQVLTPDMPQALTSGSVVDLGGREFRYESHRGA
jgi:FHA domain